MQGRVAMRQKLVPKATSDLREVSRNHKEAMLHGQSADPPGTGSITDIDTQELKMSRVSKRSGCGQQDSGSHTPIYTGIQGQSGGRIAAQPRNHWQRATRSLKQNSVQVWQAPPEGCSLLDIQKTSYLPFAHAPQVKSHSRVLSQQNQGSPIHLPGVTKGTKGQYWKAGTHVL